MSGNNRQLAVRRGDKRERDKLAVSKKFRVVVILCLSDEKRLLEIGLTYFSV
jgi:hypothetical protein